MILIDKNRTLGNSFPKRASLGKLDCLVARVVVELARTDDCWAADTCETPGL